MNFVTGIDGALETVIGYKGGVKPWVIVSKLCLENFVK